MARSITTRSINPKIMDDNIKILDDAIGALDAPDAEDVSYDNTVSHLTADDVQAAIDEVAPALTASGTSYDNTGSGLTADDVQEAIDEVNTKITLEKTNIVPNYGASPDLVARNFYVTDNLTFMDVHFCLRVTDGITHDVDIITLPDIAKNKIPQYGFGIETSNNKAHVIYNSVNSIYLDAVSVTADASGVFAGAIRISLL